MDTYQDEWMYWDQKVKLRSSANPEDRERWRDEKTRRMLLWLHHSDSAAAGSAVWWQLLPPSTSVSGGIWSGTEQLTRALLIQRGRDG
ncbi:hypothetical protein FJT64_022139 [Amphibalanus amphitrite]|uniref:Uncharacterized protein n=1 Tax=Amphibalanus amphitrite TaxID=1232801 RepID=A0A6A4WW50_AMPAM|nr:hypothetical protein FJT64_022139 [Amphibalanus amphitrite]